MNPSKNEFALTYTLGTEMFGVGDFWLETRVIIKISKIPCEPINFDVRIKQKKIFFEKKISKWRTQKKCIFQNRQFPKFFCENFWDWSLG